jgi:AraC family transcriptional regulator
MTNYNWDKKYNSLLTFYQDKYPYSLREVRSSGRIGATLVCTEQEAGDWSDAPTPDLVITQALDCPAGSTLDLGAGRFRIPRMYSRHFVCVPPGTPTTVLLDGPHKLRFLAIPYKVFYSFAEDSVLPPDGDFGALHTKMYNDAGTANLLDHIWAEACIGSPYGALWADGALLQIAAYLLRLKDGRTQKTVGGLAPWQLNRVREYLAANLHTNVSLTDLSELCGISPSHFSRAYKHSTGQTPVQTLIALRMERACALLSAFDRPVIEVAADCGYDSPSAFARLFRRALGVAPSEWRRQMRV